MTAQNQNHNKHTDIAYFKAKGEDIEYIHKLLYNLGIMLKFRELLDNNLNYKKDLQNQVICFGYVYKTITKKQKTGKYNEKGNLTKEGDQDK